MMNRDMGKKLNELKEWIEKWEEGVKTIMERTSTQGQEEREGE